MKKAVLLSIKPRYCELIASGKKTVEIRKNRPGIDVPFKCYIYCTKEKLQGKHGKYLHTSDKAGVLRGWDNPNDCDITLQPDNYTYKAYSCSGKVIGEFVCDEIKTYDYGEDPFEPGEYIYYTNFSAGERHCLTNAEISKYGGGKLLCGWHISDLVIYDKPIDLDEFEKPCSHDCKNCKYWYSGSPIDYEPPCCEWEDCVITHPPQSWCYVEELDEELGNG